MGIMAIHPKDLRASNPRLQCCVCGKWKRLNKSNGEQTFYGGCNFSNGDHLAGKTGPDGCNDVCDECCERECLKLKCAQPLSPGSILFSAD